MHGSGVGKGEVSFLGGSFAHCDTEATELVCSEEPVLVGYVVAYEHRASLSKRSHRHESPHSCPLVCSRAHEFDDCLSALD